MDMNTNPSHTKDFYKKNAEEDYITTPISVLRYITELEEAMKEQREFRQIVRDFFNAYDFLANNAKNNIRRLIRLDEAAKCREMINEHLSSFTEQEQSNTKDNGS